MLDHVSLVVTDFDRSVDFYDRCLEPLGIRRLMTLQARSARIVDDAGERDVPVADRPVMSEAEWPGYLERIGQLADWMAANGVAMAFHHHMGTAIERAAEVDRLMEGTPNSLGLLFDTGHAYYGGAADPAALSARLPPAQLALVASGQGTGATGRIQLSHLQAELAGARLTAQGQLGLDGSADLRAQASVPSLVALQPPVQSLLSLRGETEPLPLSSLAGAIEASAHVVRTAEQLRLDADLTGSGLRGFGGAAAQLSASVHTVDRSGSARLEARGLRFVIDCIAEYGGVHARKPKTITYADGI